MSNLLLEKLTDRIFERWMDCDSYKEAHLLRMALLRELMRSIHAEKSRLLATGLKADAHDLKLWENQIEALRESSSLTGELMHLLENSDTLRKKSLVLPESLFKTIERDKLMRYDRKWEATLASLAFYFQWRLWKVEAWVEISQIEEWDKTLSSRLWPHGIILFTESAKLEEVKTVEEIDNQLIWKGQWFVLLDSKFNSTEELPLNLEQWPGSPRPAPSLPKWTDLYP